MSKNDKDKVDARRIEFEKLKETTDQMQDIIIDFEPGEVYFPAIYNPTSFVEEDKSPKWFGLTVPADVILNEVEDEYIKDKMKTSIRPPVGSCRFERMHIKSKIRSEVYTIRDNYNGTESRNSPTDLRSLHNKLTELEVRNKPKDHLFIGCHVRVHTKPYAYWSGELALLRDSIDYIGVGMGLKKVGVWIDD